MSRFCYMDEKPRVSSRKKVRPETDPRTILLAKYPNLLDVYFKKNIETFSFHLKYYHKIILKEEQKHGHVLLYKMLPQELHTVNHYYDLHLAKELI